MKGQVFAAAPLSTAGQRIIQSPLQFILTGEDNFRVVVANSLPGVRVTVQGRRIDEDGDVLPFSFDVVPTSDRLATVRLFAPGVGPILNLTAFASSGAPVSGQTYVMVQLIRGFTGATTVLGTLLAGYVTSIQALGFPGSPIVASTEGEPYVRIVQTSSPGVGGAMIETVPTGARWQIASFTVALVTSAAVANRELFMLATFGGLTVWEAYPGRVQVAGETVRYTFAPSVGRQVGLAAQNVVQSIPAEMWLPASTALVVDAENMQADDQILSGGYVARELLEVAA